MKPVTIASSMHLLRRLSTRGLLVLVLVFPHQVLADPPIIVGDGTPASCTETAFRYAVSLAEMMGGGVIRFKCGPSPVTINVTVVDNFGFVDLSPNTTIDGDGLITLARLPIPLSPNATSAAMFRIGPDASVVMKDLTISGNDLFPIAGVVVVAVNNQGTFVARNVTLEKAGLALFNNGTASLVKSTVQRSGNEDLGLPAIISFQQLDVDKCLFIRNDIGGAIRNGGSATVVGSLFSQNGSHLFGPDGGAMQNSGTLTVKHSTFADNSADRRGGAIFNNGTIDIKNTLFSGNAAPFGGAISSSVNGTATIVNSTFSGNHAGVPFFFGGGKGGGLSNAGTITIRNSLFAENQATGIGGSAGEGGGIFNSPFDPVSGSTGPAILVLRTSLITANTASSDGGGIDFDSGCPPTLIHTKVVNNTPNDIAQ